MNTNIQKKALDRTVKLIDSVDKFEISKDVKECLAKLGVSDEIRREVSGIFIVSFNEQFQKIDEAREWIVSVIKDMEPKKPD